MVNAVQGGVLNVYQWKPAFRIEDYPAAPRKVRPLELASQPSRLLWSGHEVVPFRGREAEVEGLATWRDDQQQPGFAVRLIHGPGGQGKTRLAAHFAKLSRLAGWTVLQAVENPVSASRAAVTQPPAGSGVLVVVDYAERWPVSALYELLQDPLLHRGGPVRLLLVSRPAGAWWKGLTRWIDRYIDVRATAHPLSPLADGTTPRGELFSRACSSFAQHLGLPDELVGSVHRPPGLDQDGDYAQILTIHIAALAAVDALVHQADAPKDPARASAYLLDRERAHWEALNQRTTQPLATDQISMGRAVFTATLTRPLRRRHGWDALRQIGLAETIEAANTVLDDHQYCYPPTSDKTVLEPLYPDRLGEDFLGLTTPGHTITDAVTDDWADQAPARLLGRPGTGAPAPWTRDTLTVLIEAARRWDHIAARQLYPLLKAHPELAIQAGGAALTALANLDGIDPTVLEAIEPHLPQERHADLDIGIATLTYRLAQHRLATTQDPLAVGTVFNHLAIRLHCAGLREEALVAIQKAIPVWRHLVRTEPQVHEPGLAIALDNLGYFLAEVGRRDEALPPTEEAVGLLRRLAAAKPQVHAPDFAESLTNLSNRLAEAGRGDEALASSEEAIQIYRTLAAAKPRAHEPNLAMALDNLGNRLAEAGRLNEALPPTEEAVAIRRRLASAKPQVHAPDFANSLSNLGNRLAEAGRGDEALPLAEEAAEIYRTLAGINPQAHQPNLAMALGNLGASLTDAGRHAEALPVTMEATQIYRTLAVINPQTHERNLAMALSNLAGLLADVGRRDEATATAQEAVTLRRRLIGADPQAHESDLAMALWLSAWVRVGGEEGLPDALGAVSEASEIFRRLAEASPAAYEGPLQGTLTTQAVLLEGLGRAEEAEALRRRLREEPE
ncbi:tetratricopeptide repeat protein [Streptomyces sp. YU58]|uniref:tetratricopeptide repeat protein n=1 Tax=Streptomyces sp. SX92 TaxID=3158972 RepID=UPI0027B9751B|nr:tetratricopeptide repeat protein [Streptomyces coralus]WLW55289.1 tetratricopeptide repeat protein [Streptomyces coralus]